MMMPTQPTQQAVLQDTLLKAFGNSADSLTYNRQGTLAPNQKDLLLAQIRRDKTSSLSAALVAASMVIVTIALTFVRPDDRLAICMVITGFVVLMSPGFIYVMLKRARTFEAEVKDNKVASIDGPIEKWESGNGRNGLRHNFTIGQKTFLVSGKVYSVQVDGWQYRLYYLPRLELVVAIEPLAITSER